MAPFPLVKLGYLAVKQISKPLANFIKRKAKASPLFRTYICIPPAQFYHWMEVNFRLRLLGLGRAKNVEKLGEKEAIELGGEMLGEFLVFFSAALILLSEYQRGANKEYQKEEKARIERENTKAKLNELSLITEVQEAQIRDLQRKLDTLTHSPNKEQQAQKNSGIVKRLFSSN